MESDYRDLSVAERLFGKPLSGIGWWSLALAAAFVLLLLATGISGGHPPNLLLLAALACCVASGIAGGIGIVRKHERSPLLWGTLLLGALLLLVVLGEIFEGAPPR